MARFEMTPDTPFSGALPVEERVTAFLARGVRLDVWRARDHRRDRVDDCVVAGVRDGHRDEPAPVLGVDDRPTGDCVRVVGPRRAARGVYSGPAVYRLLGVDGRHDLVRAARVHGRVGRHDVLRHGGHVRRDGGLRHHDASAAWPDSDSSCSWVSSASCWRRIVGMFWHSDALQFVISFIGVIVFTGSGGLRRAAAEGDGARPADGRSGSYAIVGALALYLDFINLFLLLLRFTGSRRD